MPPTKVLVVEDEGLIAHDIATRLKGNGYEVVGVSSSGESALETLSQVTPDLVLMDIRLDGEMDGIEAAKKVRMDFQLPVVFLTAHADRNTLSRATLADPFGYLLKPFGNVDLSIQIEIALRKHSLERELNQKFNWVSRILASSPDPMFVTDNEGIVQFMNAEAARMMNCFQSDWRGRRFHEIVALYELISGRAADDFVGSVLANKTSSRDDVFTLPSGLCFRDPRGHEVLIEGKIAAVLMSGHENLGAVITLQDITVPLLVSGKK